MYTYIVEDGQFSSEHFLPSLLGEEGETVTIYDDEYGTDIFIASIKTYLYQRSEEERLERRAKRMHRRTQIGALLLVVGFLFQIAGNLIK